MKRILLSALLVVGVSALAVRTTISYFTDTASTSNETIQSGILSIDDSKVSQNFSFGTLKFAPGEVQDNWVSITVQNNGNIPLVWVGKFVYGGTDKEVLKDAIYFDEMRMDFLKSDGVSPWETSDQYITNGTGSGSWPTTFVALANGETPYHVITLDAWERNGAMLPPYPYHFGALNPGYMYKISFKLGMYKDAGNDYQNKTMTIGYQVNATQATDDAFHAMMSGLGTTYAPSQQSWINAQLIKQP